MTHSARLRARDTAVRYSYSLEAFRRWVRQRESAGRARIFLDVLSAALLSEFYVHLQSTGLHGRPRSEDTARKNVEVIQLAWEWTADQDEYVDFCPRPRRIEMRRSPPKPTLAPTWDEVDSCIAAMPGWKKRALIIMRFTGLRIGQVTRLLWDDVDLERAHLLVRPELGKSDSEKRGRRLPLSPHFVAEMSTWGRREGFLVDGDRSTMKGDRMRVVRAKEVKAAWLASGVRSAIWKGRPDHAFRKCFVTELRHAGAKPEAVEFYVGHSLGLADVYTDPRAHDLTAIAAAIPPLTGSTVVRSLDARRTG